MATIEELRHKAPAVKSWINNLLLTNQGKGTSALDYNFPNLIKYYDETILSAAKVIVADKIPQVPLASLGLPEFTVFESGNYDGVTYLDTYFVVPAQRYNESLHFHELIHVVQWARLGVDKFIMLYGILLLQSGYRNNPLEEMAYRYQNLFQQNRCPSDLVQRVCGETDNLLAQYINMLK
jgi:hypothetical protein